MKNQKTKGMALISILATTAIALLLVTVATLVAIINAKVGLDQRQYQTNYQAVESVAEEMVLRFIRERNLVNVYPDWTQNCLQITNFECKMELNLEASGGTIDIWGKTADKIRHLQLTLVVTADNSVQISSRKDIF